MPDCPWCHVAVEQRDVLIGPPPGTPVSMFVGVDPDPSGGPEGTIIVRNDGRYRLLHPDDHRDPNKQLFRSHGKKNCSPRGRYHAKPRR